MGVAIAMGVAGLAGGIMGSMGQQSQAEAQYMANKIEVDRNNFLNAMKNDKQNFASAKANAMRRWNNIQISKAATENLALERRAARKNWRANAHNNARSMVNFMASLDSESTGRGMRGGTADAIERQADAAFARQRLSNTTQRWQQETNAKARYDAALAKRDQTSQNQANIFMPGSSGVAPGNGSMNMLIGALGGATSGISAGLSAQAAMDSVEWGKTPLGSLFGGGGE